MQSPPYSNPGGFNPAYPPSEPRIEYRRRDGVSVGEAFRLFFDDANTVQNLLMATLFSIIPIVGPIALMGWYAEIQHRVIRQHPQVVPRLDFSDFGEFLGKGIYGFVGSLAIGLPFAILIQVFMFFVMGAAFAVSDVGDEPSAGIFVVMLLTMAAAYAFMLVAMNAVMTRADLTLDFGKTFQMGELFGYMRRTLGLTLGWTLVFGLISIPIMILGMLAFFVGIFPASIVLNGAMAHLRAQIYEIDLSRGGSVMPIAPLKPLPSERAANPPYGQSYGH